MQTFIDDDSGYLAWIRNNPNGFVINSYTIPTSSYLILHSATCNTISTNKRTNWTTTGYIKTCSLNRDELTQWTRQEFGCPPHLCGICNP